MRVAIGTMRGPFLLWTTALFLAACGTTSHSCQPTSPNGSTPPGEPSDPSYHGNGQLWTAIWPEGTVRFEPGGPGLIGSDGSLAMKFPW